MEHRRTPSNTTWNTTWNTAWTTTWNPSEGGLPNARASARPATAAAARGTRERITASAPGQRTVAQREGGEVPATASTSHGAPLGPATTQRKRSGRHRRAAGLRAGAEEAPAAGARQSTPSVTSDHTQTDGSNGKSCINIRVTVQATNSLPTTLCRLTPCRQLGAD